MWNLPGLGIESVSPALAGGFLCHHGSPTGAVFKSQIPHVANYAFSVLVVPRVPLWPINGRSVPTLLEPGPPGKISLRGLES